MTWENRLTFEISSADPDSDTPMWVDFTLRIRDISQSIEVNIGRQDDLEGSSPTVFTLLLENADDALTFGNTTSPYFSWWGPGRKCRLRETVAGVIMDLATGYLQTPTETLTTVDMEHRVALTIVDRLARQGSTEPFISTLAAHILGSADASLKAYYPLNDSTEESFASVIPTSVPLRTRATFVSYALLPTTVSPQLAIPQGGPSVPADDIPSLALRPSFVSTGAVAAPNKYVDNTNASNIFQGSFSQVSGETISLVWWSTYTANGTGGFDTPVIAHLEGIDAGVVTTKLEYRFGAGSWQFEADGGTAATTLTLTAHPQGVPVLHAMRLTITSGLAEFWRGPETPVTALTGGAVPASVSWYGLRLGAALQGSLGHVQVYCGVNAYTREQHLAQHQMGLYGLERQTTGERIRTILGYAGVRGYEMNIDQGSSVMQRATLAGKTSLDAVRDAERTEQGLVYVDGSGMIIFKDRRSLYNV